MQVIKSTPYTKQGRDNWDAIYAKKSAYEWLRDYPENYIIDPDGWRYDDVTMDTPITKRDFNYRLSLSTVNWTGE